MKVGGKSECMVEGCDWLEENIGGEIVIFWDKS